MKSLMMSSVETKRIGNRPLEPKGPEVEFFQCQRFCNGQSKFTDSQIADEVKRVEARFAAPDICWKLGISIAA